MNFPIMPFHVAMKLHNILFQTYEKVLDSLAFLQSRKKVLTACINKIKEMHLTFSPPDVLHSVKVRKISCYVDFMWNQFMQFYAVVCQNIINSLIFALKVKTV